MKPNESGAEVRCPKCGEAARPSNYKPGKLYCDNCTNLFTPEPASEAAEGKEADPLVKLLGDAAEIRDALRKDESGNVHGQEPGGRVAQFATLQAQVEQLKHELFVTKASEKFNSDYARAFELERDQLRADVLRLEKERDEAMTAAYHFHDGELVHKLRTDLAAARKELEDFTRHVGASTFQEAVDVSRRTLADNMDALERTFNQVKTVAKERDALKSRIQQIKELAERSLRVPFSRAFAREIARLAQ